MGNEQEIDRWLGVITAHNQNSAGVWTTRVQIDGVQLLEQAVQQLETVGATLATNGGPLEYIAAFREVVAREVAGILVDRGARLCTDQVRAPVP